MEYNFESLNDKEFEILVCDLISSEKNIRIERFKPGRDGGVDGRFFSSPDNEVILQAKHYLKSGLPLLISKIKKEELEKVKKLNPSKYYFITSLPLTRENKKTIKNLFNPYIKCESDIYGAEDLNTLLSLNKHIEEKHYKLWITSTTILKRIMNNAIKGRSEYLLDQFKDDSFCYIETNNHIKALKHLKENNVLILTGEPGIGKTTLANNLSLFFVAKEYEFIAIEESISEAENVFTKDKNQIFYYDDFLGSNFLEAIQNKKDSHIMLFIDRILRDKSKIFILTSRTTIINNGLHLSAVFENKKLGKRQFLLTIDSLSEYEKAQILYNHIWYSNLSGEYQDIFYNDKNYLKIIKHNHFNPRLIEFITDTERVDVESNKYYEYIKYKLDHPHEIWAHYFKVQSNIYLRCFVYLITYNKGIIGENDLREAFYNLCKLKKIEHSMNIDYDFLTISKLATNSLVKRLNKNHSIEYQLLNPSIADYILQNLENNETELLNVFLSLNTSISLDYLLSLKNNNDISQDLYNETIRRKIDIVDFSNVEINYLTNLTYAYHRTIKIIEVTSRAIIQIIKRKEKIKDRFDILTLIDECFYHIENLDIDDIYCIIGDAELSDYEINTMTQIFKNLEIIDEIVREKFYDFRKERIHEYLETAIDDVQSSLDVSEYIDENDYNFNALENKIMEDMNDSLYSVIDEELDDELEFEVNHLVDSINISDLIDDFEQNYYKDTDFEYDNSIKENTHTDILDLFDRHL